MNRLRNTCLYCKKRVRGRIDKKFCDDSCRSSYNNKLNRDNCSFVSSVNRILKRNRKILQHLNTKGKTKVKKEKLLATGFDFNYYTNTYTTKNGKQYHFCYDQGFIKISETEYTLVEKYEYVN